MHLARLDDKLARIDMQHEAKPQGDRTEGQDQKSEQKPQAGAVRDMRFVTAESLGIATGLGYALAFLYQSGLVAYYGVPPETIRVSPEWVIFIGIAIIPSVFGFLSGVTAADWLAASTPKMRNAIRAVLLLAGGASILLSAVLGGGRGASFLLVSGILLASLALADGFAERARPNKNSRPFVVLATMAALALIVVFGMNYMGYREASTRDTYLVDTAKARVLVYSTDSVYVFAGYDPKSASLESTLTYVSSADFGSNGITLVNTKTGRLTNAAGQ